MVRSLMALVCIAGFEALYSSAGATLVWDANPETDIAGYQVYVREGTNGIPAIINVGLATQWAIAGIESGMLVSFNVTAYNAAGLESDLSDTVTYTVPLDLTVAWAKSPMAGAVSYRFSSGQLNQLAQTVNRGTNLSHNLSIARGASYFFYAEALNGAGLIVDNYAQLIYTVPSSGALPVLTLARQNIAPQASVTSPAAGAVLTMGTVSKIIASVSDSDGSIARTDFYANAIKVGSASSVPFEFNWTPAAAGTVQLSAIAVDNSGASTRSAYAAVTVIAAAPLPVAPGGITAAATSSTGIRLAWVDKSTNELGFSIYRALTGGALVKVATTAANATVFNDTGLLPNTGYQYRVSAFNVTGESAGTNCVATTFPAAPSAPASLGAQAGTNLVALSWIDASVNETSVKVYRAPAGGAFALIATLPAGTVAYTNSALTPLTAYEFRVAAVNSGGETASATVAVTTLVLPPLAPSGFTAVAQWTPAIRLGWIDNATNETGFYLYQSVNGGAFSRIGTLPANSVSFTNTSLIKGTRYDYQLTAFNAGGESLAVVGGTKTTGVAP